MVNDTFALLMGVDKLSAANLPEYPTGMDPASAGVPLDASGKPYLRFRWSEPPGSQYNRKGQDIVFKSIMATGALRFPAAKDALDVISKADLMARIKSKYEYMTAEKRKYDKRRRMLEEKEANMEDEFDEGTGEVTTSRAAKYSRVASVSVISAVRFSDF